MPPSSAKARATPRHCRVTNVVKHFKGEPHGKRRLTKSPARATLRHVARKELELIQTKIEATAAQVFLDAQVRVLRDRGKFLESEFSGQTLITIHPSALHDAAKEDGYEQFVADLREVAKTIAA